MLLVGPTGLIGCGGGSLVGCVNGVRHSGLGGSTCFKLEKQLDQLVIAVPTLLFQIRTVAFRWRLSRSD